MSKSKKFLLLCIGAILAFVMNTSALADYRNGFYIAGTGGLSFRMNEKVTYHVIPALSSAFGNDGSGFSLLNFLKGNGNSYRWERQANGSYLPIFVAKSGESFVINEGTQADFKYKMGYNINGAMGYAINGWRIELEASVRRNNLKSITVNEGSGSSITIYPETFAKNFSLMGNLYRDFYVTPCFSIYLGGGIGWSWTTVPYLDYRKIRLAWQAMTGVAYDVTDCLALTFGYRLFALKKSKQLSLDLNAAVLVDASKIPMSHGLEIGLRFKV